MRKDICFYYPAPIQAVYAAYQAAIGNVFKESASGTPYHTIVFGLGFSFKYNMNGGGCHVHLMPYNNGTAVNIRYTIAQALGARCEAHAKDLSAGVEAILHTRSERVNIDVQVFLDSKDKQNIPAPNTPPQISYAQPQVPYTPTSRFCSQCGSQFVGDARFCSKCGAKRN